LVEQVRQYLSVLEWIDADKTARNRPVPAINHTIAGAEDIAPRFD
jgi:hypothetical protein